MIALAGAGLLLTLAACGNETQAGGGSLSGNTYLSTSITEDGKPKQLAGNTRVKLDFIDDGRLNADAGCNSMQAPVSTSGGKITLKEPAAMTDMGCPDGRQQQDTWLSEFLQKKPTWKLSGDTLTVTADKTTIVLTDSDVVQPDAAIDGTKWTLNGVIDFDSVSHQDGADKAWITFNGDRVTGFTGCNELNGRIARAANTITFGELATTRRACAEAEGAMEKALVNGLKGKMTYEINSSDLTLKADNKGLTFIAAR
ncbi:META domain-containing protein [Kribbella antibiotica]|uniref:META domain-containing protein n=2 Tax=Kribbella antibiotica TaxID=190195 RepID=A0A4R4ZGH9_9ACTN|nr:META domain-containing protein [Kribbella antibiotica]